MKKKTVISLLCAGVLTVGAFTGLTGFADKDDAQDNTENFTMLSAEDTEDVDEADEVKADGTITGVADVAAEVMPAVVSITNKSVQEVQDIFGMYGYYFGYGQPDGGYTIEQESAGSGIIIGQSDDELLICTNNHVVEGATEITVGFVDNEIYEAVVKGTDAGNDLAVVAVNLSDISDDTLDQIKVAQIGNSDDLVVGQQVVAIGNALGYGQSVTTGIVSALNRTIQLDGYDNTQLIQTDAAINGGNSGGALLDMNGHVIGINSAKVAESGVEGMGYAIPISYAQPILEDLMNKKTRTETVEEEDSAYIGITGESVSSEMTEYYGIPKGIFITEVAEDSPADEAGLQRGDIITKFDGSSVMTMSEMKDMLAYYAAGEEVKVLVSTADNGEYKEREVNLTLGALADYQDLSQD
ncbi:MAG: S1C family serine protease [Lachnospiraceae bacterium]|uniref:S1C family serine protease n=1 Tax=Parablautia sp. Marseille-Q6255 TaxID=3039593 RepID=UPI0024BC4528|nr:trypsin-like peptidase domain-containing protein [Parablautia sp. Marseille-Q6255]